MSAPAAARVFGLIVIGDEVLNGARTDAHLAAFKAMLAARGHGLAWYWLLPDEPAVLTRHLALAMADQVPAFCCGGIGATPDDHTRACAAAAAGVGLVRHPQAQALIEGRFGSAAYPHRILMADLPAGCLLIPNPHNQIPGFGLQGLWFLPGFPQLAWPMAEGVLDRQYPPGQPLQEAAVEVHGVPESRLIPLMQEVGGAFPACKVFSLPHLDSADGGASYVLLGVRGRGDLNAAMQALRHGLTAAAMEFRESGLVPGDA
ncbi:MAG: competence/damage-inducible protein A [Chromatiaceae bacterium]|nr:MAG: competence/damage-inducible protein A [Chromatiaceae bacterium]